MYECVYMYVSMLYHMYYVRTRRSDVTGRKAQFQIYLKKGNRLYVCMYCMYIHMCVVFECMLDVCMSCVCICMCLCLVYLCTVCMYACMYACMYVYMYVYMYVCMYLFEPSAVRSVLVSEKKIFYLLRKYLMYINHAIDMSRMDGWMESSGVLRQSSDLVSRLLFLLARLLSQQRGELELVAFLVAVAVIVVVVIIVAVSFPVRAEASRGRREAGRVRFLLLRDLFLCSRGIYRTHRIHTQGRLIMPVISELRSDLTCLGALGRLLLGRHQRHAAQGLKPFLRVSLLPAIEVDRWGVLQHLPRGRVHVAVLRQSSEDHGDLRPAARVEPHDRVPGFLRHLSQIHR